MFLAEKEIKLGSSSLVILQMYVYETAISQLLMFQYFVRLK
uniref:Uncharacterized protein n=1 Tax=Rhizophora mucronata TaxID=61149 RepID=A0A2P2PDD5_RHIMU